ncbi:MAG: carboxypeptidase-like regulatory domain-containing protein, partial [Candidatus Eremiobacteraeota bacterium]|nr:carboxypeptidase-like regulatory domain-containing protein [Candidatus Eremiobacteraeota bacterium]
MQTKGLLRIALLALMVLLFQGTWALAGTTGNIEGTVRDQNGSPVAGAKVSVASPSQAATNLTTGPNGFWSALNLSPDTYTITASKEGYDPGVVYGVTVQADQTTRADVKLNPPTKVLGRVTTTATASVVSRTVTGDLYAVNAQAINSYQGASGGSESLYSQNAVVGSLPGVVRAVGSGGGYFGQGTLSLRGGAFDQVGYELDGVPLNRGFDFYNGTAFLTNGLA